MELIQAIRQRRAVRDYRDEAIDPWMIKTVIEAAVAAPSARNLQPWSFWIFTRREEVERLAEKIKEWLLKSGAVQELYAPIHQLVDNPSFSIFYHAAALILVVAKSQERQASDDCCLAAQNLMLAARDLRIGTCWIGLSRQWFDLPGTKNRLGIPEEYRVVAPIVMGYPREWPETHGRDPADLHWCSLDQEVLPEV